MNVGHDKILSNEVYFLMEKLKDLTSNTKHFYNDEYYGLFRMIAYVIDKEGTNGISEMVEHVEKYIKKKYKISNDDDKLILWEESNIPSLSSQEIFLLKKTIQNL